MKPPCLKHLFNFIRPSLKSVANTENSQHSEESRGKLKLLSDDPQETGVLYALGRPPEDITAALVASDAGDPSMLNELVKEGYVVGFIPDAIALWHTMNERDNKPASFSRESVANSSPKDAAHGTAVDNALELETFWKSIFNRDGAASFREAVANASPEAASREAAVANALDPAEAIDFSESADGWFKISPYGVFRGKTPGRPQHVSVDNAKAMEGEFNSMLGTLGRLFRGIPIYHGHPDVDPEIWPDDRRIGSITKLDARADGLWGFAEWNSLGDQNKAEGWWIYPSPRWDSPKGQKNFSPDRLISIGLTNTPRIEDSEPVFNTLLENETEPNQPMDPKVIRQKLGLAPEATDEECLTKLDAVIAAATKAPTQETELANAKMDLTTAKTALTAANTKKDELACTVTARDNTIVSLREAHNNSLLDAAEKETRITPADRPVWLSKLNGTNREAEINSLKSLKPRLNSKAIDLGNRREERAQSDNLREQVANAVAKLQKDEGLSFDAAWQRAKKQAEFKPYFDRSES